MQFESISNYDNDIMLTRNRNRAMAARRIRKATILRRLNQITVGIGAGAIVCVVLRWLAWLG